MRQTLSLDSDVFHTDPVHLANKFDEIDESPLPLSRSLKENIRMNEESHHVLTSADKDDDSFLASPSFMSPKQSNSPSRRQKMSRSQDISDFSSHSNADQLRLSPLSTRLVKQTQQPLPKSNSISGLPKSPRILISPRSSGYSSNFPLVSPKAKFHSQPRIGVSHSTDFESSKFEHNNNLRLSPRSTRRSTASTISSPFTTRTHTNRSSHLSNTGLSMRSSQLDARSVHMFIENAMEENKTRVPDHSSLKDDHHVLQAETDIIRDGMRKLRRKQGRGDDGELVLSATDDEDDNDDGLSSTDVVSDESQRQSRGEEDREEKNETEDWNPRVIIESIPIVGDNDRFETVLIEKKRKKKAQHEPTPEAEKERIKIEDKKREDKRRRDEERRAKEEEMIRLMDERKKREEKEREEERVQKLQLIELEKQKLKKEEERKRREEEMEREEAEKREAQQKAEQERVKMIEERTRREKEEEEDQKQKQREAEERRLKEEEDERERQQHEERRKEDEQKREKEEKDTADQKNRESTGKRKLPNTQNASPTSSPVSTSSSVLPQNDKKSKRTVRQIRASVFEKHQEEKRINEQKKEEESKQREGQPSPERIEQKESVVAPLPLAQNTTTESHGMDVTRHFISNSHRLELILFFILLLIVLILVFFSAL
ncbi:hypothetical protein BLNAU_3539 [Blattamonas nauphoetae]|uniref:Uncharacterized protein n=1 Tax=Blattamonas nauphoetae TaxID=2049346 RepID=A0ABQ9YCK5_9EUKA|nr:hypothetical protein BLNAU_3539 [Blattamonas nauphoetae]